MGTDRQRLLFSYVPVKLKKSTDYNPVLFDFEIYFTISNALLISFKSDPISRMHCCLLMRVKF